ncbi:MAG: hypothetical protein ACJAVI_001421 [Candidatus Azotimanducaceae bacterium]|jgi:hypothetical protein
MFNWSFDKTAKIRALSLIIALTALWYPTQGIAHRQHLSWSTIEWNANAKVLEITHRVHAHDASAWLTAQSKVDIAITDIEQQAKFALYCSKTFKLRNGQQWQTLELVGAELQGNYLLTYQQLSLDLAPTSLSYRATILMDFFSDQEHVVNTILENQTTSLNFNLQNTYQDVKI